MGSRLAERRFNWSLAVIPVILLICVISLINLRNADYYSGDIYHQRQVIWYLLSVIVAVVVAALDLKIFERLAWPAYIVVLILLVVCLFWGKEVNSSKRWVEIAGMNIQPSELLKIAMVLILGRLLREMHRPEYHTIKSLWKVFLVVLGPAVLVLLEPDLGTTLCILFIAATMILYEGVKFKTVALLLGIVLLVFPLSWKFGIIQEYQKDRVRLWLDPDQFKWDPEAKKLLDKTLQPEQALWAIGAGGFLGKGSFQASKTRLKYLPEMQTDFILATYAEEHGFLGCLVLLLLFAGLLLWGAYVARNARDRFGVLVAVGVTAYMFWQTVMNVGMVTGLLPVVGITLPFMSYGGSSLLSVMVGVGLLMNIGFYRGRV
ncbi:MAG: rod shape-determining protein RodA [Deltaproteobacteria bacterium]|nr:rod shape-determining protein RodA [Deltaproteobacteria bacterium]